jgi:hypothetical protein
MKIEKVSSGYKDIVKHWKLRRVFYDFWPWPCIEVWSNEAQKWLHLFSEK